MENKNYLEAYFTPFVNDIGIILILSILFFGLIYSLPKLNKIGINFNNVFDNKEDIPNNNVSPTSSADMEDITTLVNFDPSIANSLQEFDKILKDKFEFYYLNDLAAYVMLDKEISNNILFEVKEKYYIDISASLNPNFINNLAVVYTKHGLQLHINQTFLKLFNKYQVQFAPKNINKRTLDAIIGE